MRQCVRFFVARVERADDQGVTTKESVVKLSIYSLKNLE